MGEASRFLLEWMAAYCAHYLDFQTIGETAARLVLYRFQNKQHYIKQNLVPYTVKLLNQIPIIINYK